MNDYYINILILSLFIISFIKYELVLLIILSLLFLKIINNILENIGVGNDPQLYNFKNYNIKYTK